ncbi:MAG TPA: hypothetical protein VGA22_02325 [Gemmatimonadales bacterium]|jgi:hypothetical protein
MQGNSSVKLMAAVAATAVVAVAGFVALRPASAASPQVTVYRSPT